MADFSSQGVNDEIHLRCHSDNIEEIFYVQLTSSIIEILFLNIVESMHDTVTKWCL